MAVALGRRKSLVAGPWKGVFNSKDPFDDAPDLLVDARNVYIPDPDNASGVYARPGFVLSNNGAAIYTDATTFKGQGAWTHFELDGTTINFAVFGGKLFRQDTLWTDVTPVGVTIDGGIATRVYSADLGGTMAVTDGVHRPWVASSLASTPIVGTYIDFDSAGTNWQAYGPPVVYGDSGFFVLTAVGSVAARIDIAWSEANDWTTGYQQTNFDNRWTLEQTGTQPIYALAATNVALYYFRARSIGAISGAVGPDLASTATHDLISNNVGTIAPQTVVQFGNTIFFCDPVGRPWRFATGNAPEPIWHQLRSIVEAADTGYPAITAIVSTATFDPTLNLYVVAIWSPSPGSAASPTEAHWFDAYTGRYVGRMSIGPSDPGTTLDCLASFVDSNGRGSLVALGSAAAGGPSGFLWNMSNLVGIPDDLATEDLVILTTEDSVTLVMEGQFAVWKDNDQVPLISVQTGRMGYAADLVWNADQATAITGTQAPIAVTITTPNTAGSLVGTPTPTTSADGMYRTMMGLDIRSARGVQFAFTPTTADAQWNVQRVEMPAVPAVAGVGDA